MRIGFIFPCSFQCHARLRCLFYANLKHDDNHLTYITCTCKLECYNAVAHLRRIHTLKLQHANTIIISTTQIKKVAKKFF